MLFSIAWVFGSMWALNLLGLLYKPKRSSEKGNAKVVIVTVGDERVLNSLKEVIENVKKLNLDYVVLSSNPIHFEKNVIVVPREEDGNKHRAIKYFVKNFVKDDEWYVFLDDDSYPLDDCFLYEIPYYERKGRVAGNGVLIPRRGKSTFSFILDWIRYFDDLTRFSFQALIKKPIYGFHGELLIVKGKVLKEIWLEMRESITEDFVFAMEVMKRGYKIFRSSTKVSIKSPNSLKDFIKQRARWANVFIDALKYRNLVPVLFFTSGVLVNVLFFFLWLFYGFTLASLSGLYYLFVYLYGSIKAKKLYAFPISFLLSSLEILAALKGLIIRSKSFVVIDKS